MKFLKRTEIATRNITAMFSQIKWLQTKIDELCSLDMVSQISNVDLLKLRTQASGPQEENLPDTQLYLVSNYFFKEICRLKNIIFKNSVGQVLYPLVLKPFGKNVRKLWRLLPKMSLDPGTTTNWKLKAETKSCRNENKVKVKAQRGCAKSPAQGVKNQDDLQKERENLTQQLKEEVKKKNVSHNVQVQLALKERKHFQGYTRYYLL